MRDSVAVGQGGHVKVVPYLVAPDDQVALDPQRLLRRRHAQPLPGRQLDLRNLERPASDELADTRFDVAELTKDDLARGDPVGYPSLRGLYRLKDGAEARIQVRQHVIVIERRAVAGPQCPSRAADQDSVMDNRLKARSRLKHAHQVWTAQPRCQVRIIRHRHSPSPELPSYSIRFDTNDGMGAC